MLRTNLHVASDLAGIPKFRLLRTPNWLRFDFIEEVDCEGEVTFDIPLDEIDGGVLPGDSVVVAARAVVEGEGADGTHPRCLLGDKCVAWGKGPRFRPRLPAMYFTYEVQELPPPAACICDGFTAGGGTTGAAILAQLCPGGALAPDVLVDDSALFTAVFRSDRLVEYSVSPRGPVMFVARPVEPARYLLLPTEAAECKAHLRVSCGLSEP